MLQDDKAEYTATRFDIAPDTGLLVGKYSYTNRGLSDNTDKYANAGKIELQHACVESCQNAAAALLHPRGRRL